MAGRPPRPPRRPHGTVLTAPDRGDWQVVGYYLAKVVFGLGLLQLVPVPVALALAEWNAATALTIGAGLAVTVGKVAELRLFTRAPITWSQGMVIVALAWLLGPVLVAVPLYLSGHFGGYVDALFDAMSGLTTSGLTVIQDLDHLAVSMNLLRHLTQFAGGQGIIVVVLSLLAGAGGQVGILYVGEAREERVLPNVVRTAKFILLVALGYLALGTAALWVANLTAGMGPFRALYHGVTVFMAGFDTGGFSPYSTSIAYYHSAAVEGVTAVLMIAGTLSFGLHYQLWRGRAGQLTRHLEIRSLAITLFALGALAMLGLARAGTFTGAEPLFRKGFFTALSAHTGTGFGVNSPELFLSDWGPVAPAALVGAMALGGMASSTAGGFKAIRVGLAAKGIAREVRRVLLPESSLVVESYHAPYRRILRDSQVRAAVTIVLLYVASYLAGGVLGMFFGYDFESALFESTSATANVGLSVGLVGASLELPLKLTYTVQMWLGRLEFMAAFALIGYVVAQLRGRR